MFLKKRTYTSTEKFSDKITRFKEMLKEADAVLIGAGAGFSVAAGFTYAGERFEKLFADFIEKYRIPDMYSGGFYPFETLEEYWAWWSRQIYYNRYVEPPEPVYSKLFELVKDKEYFVLTTNVDHCFQKAGFDKKRLFYTQGDYGLFQCSKPCCQKTFDNEQIISDMMEQERDMRIPSELTPKCPYCGRPLTTNLRADNTFVQDEGWYQACERYETFVRHYGDKKIIYLELGVGYNTPGIIKYPFWKLTLQNEEAVYVCINKGEAVCPKELKERAICIDGDIKEVLDSVI